MTNETKRQFNDRRALDEKDLANRAADVTQSIANEQRSELHAREALEEASSDLPQTTALGVTAVDGLVALSHAKGDVTRLTPNAAALTSDILLAVSRDAGRQRADPAVGLPDASRDEPTAADRAR